MKNKSYEKIILISLDTLRADCIPSNPTKLYKNKYKLNVEIEDSILNQISKKGFFFNNVISVAPYTSASHAAYFTGKWPKNNGLYDQFNSKLRSDVDTIFKLLKKNGYETIFKTDFPFILGKYLNLIRGVDKYFIEDDKAALSCIKENKKQLIFFHFGQIHYPYGFHNLKYGGKDYVKKLDELEKKYKINTGKMNLDDMAIESFRSDDDIHALYRYKKIISHLYKNGKDSDLFNLYLEGINYFNKKKLNNFLSELLRLIEKENYLVVIFADHGEAWNDRSYGHHNSLDEEVLRVPIIFYSKDIKPKIYQNRIRTIDLTPTIADILGIKSEFDGKSLKNIIYDKKIEEDRDAFSSIWVNESHAVIKQIRNLLKKDKVNFNKSRSIKYGASIYKKDFRYIEYYKKFTNRSEELIDYSYEELYKKSTVITKKQPKILKELKTKLSNLNNINTQSNISSEEIKSYLRLQGYKV